MGLFSRRNNLPPPVSEPPIEARSAFPNGMFAPSSLDFTAGGSTAGIDVSASTALQNVAVWACQRVLVSTISGFPVDVIRVSGPTRTPVAAPAMVRSPSGRVSRRGWVAQCVRSLVGSGNIYGDIVSLDSLGRATQVETVDGTSVQWLDVDGEETPFVDGKRRTLYPLGDFWHVPASQFLMPGSRVAMNPVDFARTSIGTGIAAERFGANFFRDGLNPTAVATVDAIINQEQARAIKDSIMAMSRGTREPAVLGKDVTLTPWSANMHDSQFIELLQFEVSQACRTYGVPPSMVFAAMSGQNITYQNISQADLQYLKHSVTGWMIDLEDAWSDLIAIPHSVKFNVDALLRMDALSRIDLTQKRLDARMTTINYERALEDLPPFDDPIYDMPGIPGGAQPLGQMIKEMTPGVGVLITADEGRSLLNASGADLLVPGPEFDTAQPTLPGMGVPL